MSIRYPWNSLIFGGFKRIENRNQNLRDGLYAVYCPTKHDWEQAMTNKEIQRDITTLGLQLDDIDKYTGFIIGLVDLAITHVPSMNSCYWNEDFKYHYHINRLFLADCKNFIQYNGHQGTKAVQPSDSIFATLQEWEKHLK